MSDKIGLKQRLKHVLQILENQLQFSTESFISSIIETSPQNQIDEQRANINPAFFIGQKYDFWDFVFSENSNHIFDCYVNAANCFFDFTDINTEYPQFVPQIFDCKFSAIDIGNKHLLFFINENFEDFFDYGFTETGIDMVEFPEEGMFFSPSLNDIVILYYYLAHTDAERVTFISIDSGFNYRGKDFAKCRKSFFKQTLQKNLSTVGIYDPLSNIDIIPFDYYFKTICPEQNVNYFLNSLKKCIENHSFSFNNIGRYIPENSKLIIAKFAYASNNFVGTMYQTDDISQHIAKASQRNLNPATDKLNFANKQYANLFRSIAQKASNNLTILEDRRLLETLATSEWLFTYIGKVSGLDNTFICAGYFKLVELLLSKILISDYSGDYITTAKGARVIDESERWLMLGNMFYFASNSSSSPISHNQYQPIISAAFDTWTKHIRNGYFHKDILSSEEVLTIRNKTFEVIYMILGTLPK